MLTLASYVMIAHYKQQKCLCLGNGSCLVQFLSLPAINFKLHLILNQPKLIIKIKKLPKLNKGNNKMCVCVYVGMCVCGGGGRERGGGGEGGEKKGGGRGGEEERKIYL